MLKADKAEVSWDAAKKCWVVRIQIGEEVIRRTSQESAQDLDEASLRVLAVETAANDGYQLAPESVTIQR